MFPRLRGIRREISIYARPVRRAGRIAPRPARRLWLARNDGWSAFALSYAVGVAIVRGPVDDLLRVLAYARVASDIAPYGERVLVRGQPVVAMWWVGEPLPPMPADARVVLTRYAEGRPLMVDLAPDDPKEDVHA